MSKRKKIIKLLPIERIGIILSIVCAVHCMAMPFLLFFAPMLLSSFVYSTFMELALVLSSFILAAILLFMDYRKHHKTLPLLLLFLGILVKVLEFIISSKSFEWVFGILLGLSIGLAYWVNYQHKTSCTCKIKS